MTPTSGRRAPAVDTTGKPGLEKKWQALVQGVVDAKATAEAKRQAWAKACERRGPAQLASPEASAAADSAKADYEAAVEAVKAAGARMKAGEL